MTFKFVPASQEELERRGVKPAAVASAADPQPTPSAARRRSRGARGQFAGDDPATPDKNEAWADTPAKE